MKICIYCGQQKSNKQFSDEHIWPDALGGGALPDFWRTQDVCIRCNNLSGLFVDGEFIKGIIGNMEQYMSGVEYVDVSNPATALLPLAFVGSNQDEDIEEGTVVEHWIGPCGATILHFRPDDKEDIWSSYAGGDPRGSAEFEGESRVYIALTSEVEFWIIATLAAVKAHFRNEKRVIVNAEIPEEWTAFQMPDATNAVELRDMSVVNGVLSTARADRDVHNQVSVRQDSGNRFLSKLGLAVGYRVFGERFLGTRNGENLRKGFREANPERRPRIPVQGAGYFSNQLPPQARDTLAWRGAWVLVVWKVREELALVVITPSGKTMTVMVCDEAALMAALSEEFTTGVVWFVIPTLGTALGPLSLVDYVDYKLNGNGCQELVDLEDKRIGPEDLPPC